MNALFNQSMTVYNYYLDEEEKERWNRTVIEGVQWMHNRNEVTTSNNVQVVNKVESITIDFKKQREVEYLPPVEYRKLSVEEKVNYWTLDAEIGKDMIVLGEVLQELDDNYRLSDLRKDYQYACIVKSVTDNRHMRHLKHIKVVAK